MDYEITSKRPLYKGFFAMHEYTVEHECFAGGRQQIKRENMERGDAVAMLLYDPQVDEVLLLEQFRIGPAVRKENPWLIEIVAGMVDKEESEEKAVLREAEEESGYSPYESCFLGRYYTTPGACSERIDLFLGLVDKDSPVGNGGGKDGEHEDIHSFWVTRELALQWLAQGKINSGAPMLALMMAFGWQGVVTTEPKVDRKV